QRRLSRTPHPLERQRACHLTYGTASVSYRPLTTDHFLMEVCGIREALLELGEFAQEREAHLLALLRMELGREDVVVPDGGGERRRVIGLGGDEPRVARRHVVGVDEVSPRRFWQAAQDRRGPANAERVPAHVRHFEFRRQLKAYDFAGEEIEPLVFTVFVTLGEKQLQTQADAEKRL